MTAKLDKAVFDILVILEVWWVTLTVVAALVVTVVVVFVVVAVAVMAVVRNMVVIDAGVIFLA